MAIQILQTKFFIPPSPPSRIARPQLTARLNGCLQPGRKLALVSAPAGFGKSSLLASWIEISKAGPSAEGSSKPLFGWLSLDGQDNDPARFWVYFAAALARQAPGLGAEFSRAVQAQPVWPDPETRDTLLVELLNDLAGLDRTMVLVLDDVHLITNVEIHSGLTFLIEHLPPQLRLVVATRSDPPLPVAPLRARGQLVEIRAADLRFTPAEADAFLNQSLGLSLSGTQVDTLEHQTEGWAAGLQMAGLAIQTVREQDASGNDLAAFIQSFSGTHNYILDYLAGEVLNRQPEPVRAFLYQTAILNRLSGSLCDAVLNAAPGESQKILEYLERSNLFLVPLDAERRWYRYHHLFADLLESHLRQEGPARIAELHARAAGWFEDRALEQLRAGSLDGDLVDQALRHGFASGDFDRAARILERFWRPAAQFGTVNIIWEWMKALPESVLNSRPKLNTGMAWMLYLKGQALEMEGYLRRAGELYAALQTGDALPLDDADFQSMPSELASLRSVLARHQREYDHAVALAWQARELAPDVNPLMVGITALNMAGAYHGMGDLNKAADAYREAVPNLLAGRNPLAAMTGAFYLTRILMLQGRMQEAEQICRDYEPLAGGPVNGLAFGLISVALADLLRERGDLERAGQELQKGLDLGRRNGYFEILKHGFLMQARLSESRGDLAGALTAVQDSGRFARKGDNPGAQIEMEALRARLLVKAGRLDEADPWVADLQAAGADSLPADIRSTVYARWLLARERVKEAQTLLAGWALEAERAGMVALEVEIQILLALAHDRLGQTETALIALQRAVELAHAAGYYHLLVDEGAPLAHLLEQAQARGWSSDRLEAYAGQILSGIRDQFPLEPQTTASTAQKPIAGSPSAPKAETPSRPGPGVEPLVEPLSERELEVLRLLAAGRSNREMARELFLALGTVKTHIHNIFAKLGVESRIQAVARARDLGLL